MRELIDPNIHIALVHFPIALLIVGVTVELLSFLGWRRSSLRSAGRWMILIGAMAGVPAALSGVYALYDVAGGVVTTDELREAFREHILFTSIATILALGVSTLWIGSTDRARHMIHWPAMVCLLIAVALTIAGANHGGKLVFEHGVGVGISGVGTSDDDPEPSTQPAAAGQQNGTAPAGLNQKLAAAMPPLQTHTVVAGLGIALAVVSLGVVSRSMLERQFLLAAEPPDRSDGDVIADARNPASAYAQMSGAEKITQIDGVRPGPIVLLAALLTAGASATGLWFLAHDSDVWNLAGLWQQVSDRGMNDGRWLTRRLTHVIAGGTILLVPLILLAIARFAPRARILSAVLSILLLAAIAVQVWLGVLLMFDEDRAMGSPFRW